MKKYMCDIKNCNSEAYNCEEFVLCRGYTTKSNNINYKPFEKPDFSEFNLCEKHQREFAKLTYNWLAKIEKW